jgi:AAA domain
VASAASEQNPALALNTPPSSRPCGAATPLPEGNPPVKLIGPQERLAEKRGVSALIVGPTGVGKTSLLRTLNQKMLSKTLFIDIEAGDLPIAGLSVAGVRLRTMQEFTDLACAIGGPNPALPPNSTYSTAHYHQVSSNPELMRLAEFDVFFVDSLTALGRLSFAHAGQAPETVTDRGKKDVRAVYGIHARNMLSALNQLQHARGRIVVFVAILDRATDDFGTTTWQPQIEGAKTARELPGILDQVITMTWVDFGAGKPPVRSFVCASPNAWGYPAKDRSGRLDQLEPPHLGKLLEKLISPAIGE